MTKGQTRSARKQKSTPSYSSDIDNLGELLHSKEYKALQTLAQGLRGRKPEELPEIYISPRPFDDYKWVQRVEFNNEGHITVLRLCDLGGHIDAGIFSHFPELKILELGGIETVFDKDNPYWCEDPDANSDEYYLHLVNLDSFQELQGLQRLVLKHLQSYEVGLKFFEGLVNLREIKFSDCEGLMSDLTPFALFPSLETLSITHCDGIHGDLSPLRNLRNLRHFTFYPDSINGTLEPFSTLTSLKTLDLRYSWPCLKRLDEALTGTLEPLRKLTDLTSLNLSGRKRLSGTLEPLQDLISLKSLDISSCKGITGNLESLEDLQSLKTLNLSKCKNLTGDVVIFKTLPHLKDISLSGCKKLTAVRRPRTSLRELEGWKFDGIDVWKSLNISNEDSVIVQESIFSSARIDRIFRFSGAKRVSHKAIIQLNRVITQQGMDIVKIALRVMQKTIMAKDIDFTIKG